MAAAQLWCTGPAHVYVAVGGTPLYLGTGEEPPVEDYEPEYEPIKKDLKGTRRPFDVQYMAEGGVIQLTVGRVVMAVLNAIESLPNPTATRGVNAFGDVGTFMIQEGMAYNLWVVNSKSPLNAGGQAAMAGLEAGRRFFAAWLAGKRRFPGTRALRYALTWQVESVYNPATGAFGLYDGDMTGLPAIS